MNPSNRPVRLRRATVLASLAACIALFASMIGATSASAAFGLNSVSLKFSNEDGSVATQAGSHPYAMTSLFQVNSTEAGPFEYKLDGQLKDALFEAPVGLVGNAKATPRCSAKEFLETENVNNSPLPTCGLDTVVGLAAAQLLGPPGVGVLGPLPLYNLEPPPGVPAQLGFNILNVNITVDIRVKREGDHNIVAGVVNFPQTFTIFGGGLEIWGNPSDPGHDDRRGGCLFENFFFAAVENEELQLEGFGGEPSECGSPVTGQPFLTLPRSCADTAVMHYEADSWEQPGEWVEGSTVTRDSEGNPGGMDGCGKLAFKPEINSRATTDSAGSATGLDFSISFNDEGLTSPDGLAQSDIKKAKITLPEGVTINPSIAEGLGVCKPDEIERESLALDAGEGCPNASKIGTLDVETPLLDSTVKGSVYLAEQDDPNTSEKGAENPFDSLIAFYMVLRDPSNGILIKLPAKVEPDEETGRLVTTVDDVPQIPFNSFQFHFREGQRAPLISPPGCGTYTTVAELTPWANPGDTFRSTSSFRIDQGVGGGACPPGGTPPFDPNFEAGSVNNDAGAYSAFLMRLTREDGEQDLTRFDAKLPQGLAAKLAGVEKCSDAAIAGAEEKSGRAEQADPSCPEGSKIGSVQTAAGVGGSLTYVPGTVYLAGPYGGDPLSVVAVVPAVAGPFDVGTVVVRQALALNSLTGEVEVDSENSDPIPHILEGIPLKVRDIRVNIDRDEFTSNPTDCTPMETMSSIWGGGSNFLSAADDEPVDRSARYQAADCVALGFSPRLAIRLYGGVRRGAFPALRAAVVPPPGQANFSRAAVTLPSSAFIEQGHFGNICTRVQYAANGGHGAGCPAASRYGYARAWSPLLDGPAQGPVYLRSSDNELPDLVVALKGPESAPVDVELSARIDSVASRLRAVFGGIPDLPVSRFVLAMQGGQKGLIVNSRNLCFKPRRNTALANLRGQNGKLSQSRPRVVSVACAKRRKAARRSKGAAAKRSARASVLGGRVAG